MKPVDVGSPAACDTQLNVILADHTKYARIIVNGKASTSAPAFAALADTLAGDWREVVLVVDHMPPAKWNAWAGAQACVAVALGLLSNGQWKPAAWLAADDDGVIIDQAFTKAATLGGH